MGCHNIPTYVLDKSDKNVNQDSRIDLPAQEDIDEEHDGKEDSKGDGEVGEPGGVGTEAPGRAADRGGHGRVRTRRSHKYRCCCGHCVLKKDLCG